ncbi:MAG TPA: hypothetical protein VEX13_03035, partial [Chloroflexia bacterium]|nr:hypothetical protein [Chloroflexia bacterium]
IERTLIDIVVRPAYSGGVMAIVEAYKRAANKVSVERMVEVLAQLQYVYPYHQAIGFFMEHSQSYSREQIELLNQHPKKFDFYADYEITEPRCSPEWRQSYPSCLEEL